MDHTATQRILVTGSSGVMGRMLRPRLVREGRVLRLFDIQPSEDAQPGENVEIVTADITDLAAVRAACAGVTAIVHLGGLPVEDTWEQILRVNVEGTRQVLEAARISGVPRVVIASSNHAVGMYERTDDLANDVAPRPDTLYGWSKAAIEALGRLYVERHGMDVIALRIGSCLDEPNNVRALATWLSPDDAGRLVNAALDVPSPGFRIVWGLSANTRGWWSHEAGRAIGYVPVDDAERYAWRLLAGAPEPDPTVDEDLQRVGGSFTRAPVGEPLRPWPRP